MNSPRPFRPAPRSAFTLIELLTVIAIIGILAAIIIPTVGKVRESARSAKCVANLRSLATAVHVFAADNKDRPPYSFQTVSGFNLTFTDLIAPNLVTGLPAVNFNTSIRDANRRRVAELVRCPADALPPAGPNDTQSTYAANPQIMPDTRYNGDYRPPSLGQIQRPGQVIMIADSGQVGEGANTTHAVSSLSAAIWYVNASDGPNSPTRADEAAATLTNNIGSDTVGRFFRYRHSGGNSVNAAMSDGSVRGFKNGEMRLRNTSIYY